MNCKNCGTLMGDMDLFCKVCGAKNEPADSDTILDEFPKQRPANGKGTVASVSQSSDNNEFTWNVYEFPKPRKTEEIDIQWPTEDYRKPRRTDLDDDAPLCWDLDRKSEKLPAKTTAQQEEDVFLGSIESEFEGTTKNVINEYESVKSRKNVFEEERAEVIQQTSPPQETAEAGQAEGSALEEFGAGLPLGFFEAVVPEGERDLTVQSFDDLPGGYPQRRHGRAQGDTDDTKEATKKAERSQFRTHPEKKESKQRSQEVSIKSQPGSVIQTAAPITEEPKPVVPSASVEKPPALIVEPVHNSSDEDLGDMEKFFTFSQKSEEFQKLLDQEYEKIQKKNTERPVVGDSRISSAISDTLNFTLTEDDHILQLNDAQAELCVSEEETQPAATLDGEIQQPEAPLPEPIPEEEAPGQFGFIPRKDRKKRSVQEELAESERIMKEERAKQPEIPKKSIYPSPEELQRLAENPSVRNPYAGHLAEMAAARDSFFRDETEEIAPVAYPPFQSQAQEISNSQAPSTEVLVTVAVKSSGAQGTTTRQTISMNPISGTEPIITTETCVNPAPLAVASMIHAEPPSHAEQVLREAEIKPEPARAESVEMKPEPIEAKRSQAMEETIEIKPESRETKRIEKQEQATREPEQRNERQPQAVSDNIKTHNDGLPFETIPEKKADDFWVNYSYEGDPAEKKFSIGKIALIVIAFVLVAEIAALGITFMAPDSKAAKMVTAVQVGLVQGIEQVTDTVTGWFDSDEKDANQEGDETEKKEPVPDTPNPEPQKDKNVLIQNALDGNKIQIISKADGLVFDPAKDYGLKDLNDSVPISNNIWSVGADGKAVYYDQEIVRALIAYDSKWIDYVNTLDQSVFSLLKPDSKAYKDAQAFSGVGKIYETFKSLSIGEIRQGEKGFYVFTQEVIEKNEGGKVTEVNKDWIYCLEPIDGKMLIVNYI